MFAIETKNLTKYYGKAKGIENVSLKVEEGDFHGFIGPNGAGKSTTIRTLAGLLFPTSGEGYIFGKNIVTEKTEILKNVGYLPSENTLYGNMKVKDVIKFSADLRGINCENEAKHLCERLSLDVSKRVSELSLGNRKKAAIVCALQHSPKLYILDEPTSGLDPLIQKEFYEILKERHEEGSTIFLSTHALWEIEKHCKSATVIKNGSIILSGKVEDLNSTGIKKVVLKGVREEIKIRNASSISVEDDTVSFIFSGNGKDLVKELSSVDFKDFIVSDPDLEEIFIHHYKG